ncbi:hypothetical protein A7G48_23005 [Salmonella enterica]|nr:hypothetical protein [Salmonella enterica]
MNILNKTIETHGDISLQGYGRGLAPPSGSLTEFSSGKLRHQVKHLCYLIHFLLQWRRGHRDVPDLPPMSG